MPLSKELLDKRGPLVTRMRELVELSNKEDRSLTAEEREEFDKLDKDQDELKTRADDAYRAETVADVEDTEQRTPGEPPDKEKQVDRKETVDQELALRSWMLAPTGKVGTDGAEACQRSRIDLHSKMLEIKFPRRDAPKTAKEAIKRRDKFVEERALTVTTTGGGHMVADEMMMAIDIALLQFGGMRQTSTIISTATGADLPMPTTNDTSNTGEIIAINTTANEQDVVFGQLVLGAFKYSSKMVRVPLELLQDSSTNVPALLGRLLGERIGRITNTHFTTGAGTTLPFGIVGANSPTAADSTVTAAAAAALTFQEVLQLKHSVDPAYRGPGSGFMGNDTTLRIMKQIADSQGRPIWMPDLIGGEPDMFDGHPYQVNQDITSGTGTKALIFGQLDKYQIREVMEMTLIRLDERYAELAQAAFLGWMRMDGALLDAGTNPVKYLTMG